MRAAFFALLLLPLAGCEPAPLSTAQAVKNLQEQAQATVQAALSADHARMADLTLPAVVKSFGGRQRFIAKLESMAAEFESGGFAFKGATLGTIPAPVASGDKLYAIVPYIMEMTGPEGATATLNPSFIAESIDGGRTWKFADAAGFGGDRGKVKQWLPDFPDGVQVPAPQRTIWKRG